MLGPTIHPSFLSSLTQVFPEHTFYITGRRIKASNKPILDKFVYLYPITPNVRVEIPWEELIQKKTWVDDYDLFIGMTEGGQPK